MCRPLLISDHPLTWRPAAISGPWTVACGASSRGQVDSVQALFGRLLLGPCVWVHVFGPKRSLLQIRSRFLAQISHRHFEEPQRVQRASPVRLLAHLLARSLVSLHAREKGQQKQLLHAQGAHSGRPDTIGQVGRLMRAHTVCRGPSFGRIYLPKAGQMEAKENCAKVATFANTGEHLARVLVELVAQCAV